MSRDLEIIHQEILNAWSTSEMAKRVSEVESVAYSNGYPEYQGPNILDFLQAVLIQYTDALRENPGLIDCVRADDPQLSEVSQLLNQILQTENQKLNTISDYQKKMGNYWFGVLDPRWHLSRRQIKKLTSSLALNHAHQG